MKTKNQFLLLASLILFFVSCSKEDGGADVPAGGKSEGLYYVLNSGDWKSNNSSLTMYDASSGKAVQGYFGMQNGRGLGNTANDIVVYGSKMYITVAGESTIEVTDLDARSLKQIKCDAQPRYLACSGGKVYVSLYDGYVARLDTATLEVETKTRVGRNPEQLAVSCGKLYVANSGGMDYNSEVGYDSTVSVIDLSSFKEVKKLDVVLNPAVVVPYENGVFVVSYGDYAGVPSALQCIDAADDVVSVVEECAGMTEVCYSNGVLYGFFSQYDENWNASITYLSYDISAKCVESPWIKGLEPPTPYKVCELGDDVCVTSSDYMNDGDVYVYDTDGVLVAKVSAGLNPVKMVKAK